MSEPLELLRPDLRGFTGYRSARSEAHIGQVWLNANESPASNVADASGSLRRYPDPQPAGLVEQFASLYGCQTGQVLLGRGSDEGIDLLVRAFCRPGADAIVVTRPGFGMYAVCARIQGARVLEVPLRDDGEDFQLDLAALADVAIDGGARLVFLATPGNPAGACPPASALLALAARLAGRALLVLDEAYIEFADRESLAPRLADCANLVILRTLSKAHALAGARIGCLLANADVVAALRCLQAPYPIPAESAASALRALTPAARTCTGRTIEFVRRERGFLRDALLASPGVARVYPSQANFLLVRFAEPEAALRRLRAAGVVVRDLRALPGLDDALRISIGTRAQNERVLEALRATEAA